METITGRLEVRFLYENSKSEGNHPFLVTPEGEYKLSRAEVFPLNDPYFDPFNNQDVAVKGIVQGEYITVDSIIVLTPEEKEDTNEQDMHEQ